MRTSISGHITRILTLAAAAVLTAGLLAGCSSKGSSSSSAATEAGGSGSSGSEAADSAASASVDLNDGADLADGEYSVPVSLTGGTGKASLTSPTKLIVKDGEVTIVLRWSSKNYDYMRIGDEKFLPVSAVGEPAVFEVPLAQLEPEMTVYADTVAMSTPHEIEYLITLDLASITPGAPDMDAQSTGTGSGTGTDSAASDDFSYTPLDHEIPSWFAVTDSMKLSYAREYSVDYDAEGRAYICIGTDEHFLLLPEGVKAPSGVDSDVVVIQQPLKSIYAASSASLDLFDKCGAMDLIKLVSSDYSSWTIQSVHDGMDSGRITFAGKYSEPDFELVAASGIDFILENNMIHHSPSTLEKLKELGFAVMVERMSYESHPLGRAEWIRLVGLLTGHLDEADAEYQSIREQFEANTVTEKTDQSVAFFYISTSGAAVIRLPNDYISKMIRLAGGNYVFDDVDTESATKATMALEMEAFYTSARDADILIYNNSIDSGLKDMDDLLAKSPLLADFKAVKDGNVWCTGENVYQQVTSVADLIEDFHAVISGDAEGKDQLNCLTRLK